MESLLPATHPQAPSLRTARVNTLKSSVDAVVAHFAAAGISVQADPWLPTVIHVPPCVHLFDHELVANGHLVLQGWSSCLPAAALAPEGGWAVLDACAAPGNKTSQLAGGCQSVRGCAGWLHSVSQGVCRVLHSVSQGVCRVVTFHWCSDCQCPVDLCHVDQRVPSTNIMLTNVMSTSFLMSAPQRWWAPMVGWWLVTGTSDGCGGCRRRSTLWVPLPLWRHTTYAVGLVSTLIYIDTRSRQRAAVVCTVRIHLCVQHASISVHVSEAIPSMQVDFLSLDPTDPKFADVRGLLLDPSCSGSGTTASRGDALLLGTAAPATPPQRVAQLARFQQAALRHALRFPGLRRLVYSTCSVHREENEDVVAAVLAEAHEAGFELADALPGWPRRGLAVVEGSVCLVRVDAAQDGAEGFFVALFVKKRPQRH